MNLEQSRKTIDEIDSQLTKLFAERMSCAAEIAAYKKENNLPVLDAGRERQKLAAISELVPDELENSARCLYSLIFSLSRAYQHRLLGNDAELPKKIAAAIEQTPNLFPPKAMVACQGVEGAYSQIACEKLFHAPNILYFSNFEAVFSAIEKGLCQYGIIPLENSTAGSVNKVYDLMLQHEFSIVRSTRLKVDHSLLVRPGTKLSDIREVYSHEQAIGQCQEFLKTLPDVQIIRCENTAAAAKFVAEAFLPIFDRQKRSPSATCKPFGACLAHLRRALRSGSACRVRAGSGQQLYPLYLHQQESGDLSGRGPHKSSHGARAQAGRTVSGALAVQRARHQPQQARKPPDSGARL